MADDLTPDEAREALTEMIERTAREWSERTAAAIEKACEIALTTGTHGVRVTWHSLSVEVEITRQVPYGTIHHHRTADRLDGVRPTFSLVDEVQGFVVPDDLSALGKKGACPLCGNPLPSDAEEAIVHLEGCEAQDDAGWEPL